MVAIVDIVPPDERTGIAIGYLDAMGRSGATCTGKQLDVVQFDDGGSRRCSVLGVLDINATMGDLEQRGGIANDVVPDDEIVAHVGTGACYIDAPIAASHVIVLDGEVVVVIGLPRCGKDSCTGGPK